MRQLMLLRHAKSSWDDPLADDFDRPLNERGQRGAQAMGDWIRSTNLAPDLVLCSAAARTVETWERLALEAEVRYSPGLYHAGPDRMLAALQGLTEGTRVMMVGHNPGMGALAAMMVRNAPIHSRFGDYPTCALTVAEFDIKNWADLSPRQGRVLHFLTPHDIEHASPHA
ncbi:SixA phosphatase family protein [Vannielia litorea]|uniref:Phosphohistidine phosphatase n=1 Tax=Vannielia litorea TaxID=1217970 RepID=A0A1N6IBK6_9RHOB|nr:histidine phosphatase family protein [Vannielia litorea]SIO29428.1 phosphohistidine phosphatase [Vannielia litorea]